MMRSVMWEGICRLFIQDTKVEQYAWKYGEKCRDSWSEGGNTKCRNYNWTRDFRRRIKPIKKVVLSSSLKLLLLLFWLRLLLDCCFLIHSVSRRDSHGFVNPSTLQPHQCYMLWFSTILGEEVTCMRLTTSLTSSSSSSSSSPKEELSKKLMLFDCESLLSKSYSWTHTTLQWLVKKLVKKPNWDQRVSPRFHLLCCVIWCVLSAMHTFIYLNNNDALVTSTHDYV